MIRRKEDGGCGHEHLTEDERDEMMEVVAQSLRAFPFVESGYSPVECDLIWMRIDGKAHIALLPIRIVYGPELPPAP